MAIRLDAPQRANIFGRNSAFATRWRPTLIIGVLCYTGYRIINPVIVRQFESSTQVHYRIPVYYGPAALLLLLLFACHKNLFVPKIRFVGNIQREYVVRGCLAISLLYLAAYGGAHWLGQPREATMVYLYSLKTPMQNAAMVISLLILPPIVEELAFRHFLLSVLPFNANRYIAVIAVLVTSILFSALHGHYTHLTTYLLLFALGVVFAWARIRSNGVALPIILHSYAIAVTLICDQVVARIIG